MRDYACVRVLLCVCLLWALSSSSREVHLVMNKLFTGSRYFVEGGVWKCKVCRKEKSQCSCLL